MSSNFILKEKLGSGTYGRVIKVSSASGEDLALKIYNRKNCGIYSSLKEVDILFRVNHPNLVKGRKLCTKKQDFKIFEDDLTGSLQELMDDNIYNFEIKLSESLEQDSEQRYIFYIKLAKKLLFSLASAATALNKAGYFHLDIKPENVLYKANPLVSSVDDVNFYLADYGLCILKDNYLGKQFIEGPWDAGTYLYLPPEALKCNTMVVESSMSWMIALTVIEFLTVESHYSYIKYNEAPKMIIKSVRELALETRQKTLDKFDEFCRRKPFTAEFKENQDELGDLLSKMLFINYEKRIKPSEISSCQDNVTEPLKIVLQQDNLFIKETFKTFLEISQEYEYKLKEITMAWTLACRMMALNRINERANIDNELNKCLEFALIFYRNLDSKSTSYLKPEKKVVNYINELEGKIFHNDLYLKAPNTEEIFNILKTIIFNTDKFKEEISNCFNFSQSFEEIKSSTEKDIIFKPEIFLAFYSNHN